MWFLEVSWPPHYLDGEGLYARDAEWEDGMLLLDPDTSILDGLSLATHIH